MVIFHSYVSSPEGNIVRAYIFSIFSVLDRIPEGTLWLFKVAMENCPFIDGKTGVYLGLPIKNDDFPWLC